MNTRDHSRGKTRCHPNGRRYGETKKQFKERKASKKEAKQYKGRIEALQFESNVKAYGLAEAMRMAGMKDPERRNQ